MMGAGHQSHRSRWGHPHLFQDIDLFFPKDVGNIAAAPAYTAFNEGALGGRKPLANELCIFAESVLAELVGMLLSEYFRDLPVTKGRFLFFDIKINSSQSVQLRLVPVFYLSATPGPTKQDLRHQASQDNKVAIPEFFEKIGGQVPPRLSDPKPKYSSALAKALRASGRSSEGFSCQINDRGPLNAARY